MVVQASTSKNRNQSLSTALNVFNPHPAVCWRWLIHKIYVKCTYWHSITVTTQQCVCGIPHQAQRHRVICQFLLKKNAGRSWWLKCCPVVHITGATWSWNWKLNIRILWLLVWGQSQLPTFLQSQATSVSSVPATSVLSVAAPSVISCSYQCH